MLEIDKRGDDQQRNENPVNGRDFPEEGAPRREKEQCGQQLDREVAEGDPAAAISAAAAERKPTEERQILVPGDLFFADRTERPLRLVYRQIERQPIDADVQKRAHHRAEDERNRAEDVVVNDERRIHVAGYSVRVRG